MSVIDTRAISSFIEGGGAFAVAAAAADCGIVEGGEGWVTGSKLPVVVATSSPGVLRHGHAVHELMIYLGFFLLMYW